MSELERSTPWASVRVGLLRLRSLFGVMLLVQLFVFAIELSGLLFGSDAEGGNRIETLLLVGAVMLVPIMWAGVLLMLAVFALCLWLLTRAPDAALRRLGFIQLATFVVAVGLTAINYRNEEVALGLVTSGFAATTAAVFSMYVFTLAKRFSLPTMAPVAVTAVIAVAPVLKPLTAWLALPMMTHPTWAIAMSAGVALLGVIAAALMRHQLKRLAAPLTAPGYGATAKIRSS